LPKDKAPQREQIKVTDKRIFTPQGELREEFRNDITPVEPSFAKAPERAPQTEKDAPKPQQQNRTEQGPPPGGDRRRTIADKAQNPGTAFSNFIEQLIAQAYMSLGMLRNPYAAKPEIDVAAARQMIEILTMLKEKTANNLTPDEEDFLSTHLGELKLAFVQRTKTI
jgi:hypothetical protein